MPACDPFVSKLSPQLFWDVEMSSIDANTHADFIIVRVMERGTLEDVKTVWAHYGPSKIQDSLVTAPSLSHKTIAFFANQFHIARDAFRAHKRANHWSR